MSTPTPPTERGVARISHFRYGDPATLYLQGSGLGVVTGVAVRVSGTVWPTNFVPASDILGGGTIVRFRTTPVNHGRPRSSADLTITLTTSDGSNIPVPMMMGQIVEG